MLPFCSIRRIEWLFLFPLYVLQSLTEKMRLEGAARRNGIVS